ncbi:MAG: hypothetical protein MUF08_17970 [Burkholderiaceae bacterium]|nr:hypothetical protein [Burkholderiaceae bacterium]
MTKYPCPICGQHSDVVETRVDRRRRVCRGGHSFATVEVLRAVWLDEARRALSLQQRGGDAARQFDLALIEDELEPIYAPEDEVP